MNICCCKTKCDCTLISVIASVIAGIIAAFLNFSGTIVLPQFVLWIFFGVALGLLALAFAAAPFACRCANKECFCASVTAFLIGVFGAVTAALVLVLVDITAGGLLASLITGLLFGFFALTITSAGCIVKNLFGCDG